MKYGGQNLVLKNNNQENAYDIAVRVEAENMAEILKN